ncbi:hypothetical protein MKO06_16815 [Gramella sp. GC03-9]|uniref:Glycine dehydrogenase n=1 Tax=Christiangramia oceanisediminis TaxID=2920386 RepID=A0A9X2L054_9FLAO|nr:hypothetical protein [Gramella oceanisediminis]MCP9201575.1 hypothetical protein [Gramella oceanisediminis]
MSKLNKLFFVDCSKAAECCNKAQYKEANSLEKFKLRLHLLFCQTCRNLASKNTKLTQTIERSKIEPCPEAQKKQWKETIKKEYVKDNA